VLHHAEEGQRAIDAGLALNPGSAFLYGASGVSKIQAGKFGEAKSDVLRAIQLSPRDPNLGVWFNELSSADIGLGHFDDAINESNRAIDEGLRTFIAYTNLATAYAMTNRIDEAKAAVATALKFNPKLTVKYMSELYSKTPAVAEGLRKAGLPEQ
jgi:adenylate cyclase